MQPNRVPSAWHADRSRVLDPERDQMQFVGSPPLVTLPRPGGQVRITKGQDGSVSIANFSRGRHHCEFRPHGRPITFRKFELAALAEAIAAARATVGDGVVLGRPPRAAQHENA